MSELLARTLARALPLFVQRAEEEEADRSPYPSGAAEPGEAWSLLVEAARSGEYRTASAAIRRLHARAEDPAEVAWSHLSLLAECVRTAYDGDPRDLPALLREMDGVRETVIAGVREGENMEPASAPPLPPIIAALDRAAGLVPFVTADYAPGQVICTREDRDPILYCLRSGHVRLTAPLPDDRRVTISILGAGAVFSAAGAPARQGIDAAAMTHSAVTLLHERAVPALVRVAPEAMHALLAALAAQLHDAHRLVTHALAHDTSVRLVTLLLVLADAFGEPASGGETLITYPTTHQDLAEMIGANRVTVTRKLTELQQQGLTLPERRNTLLVDVPGLAALMDG